MHGQDTPLLVVTLLVLVLLACAAPAETSPRKCPDPDAAESALQDMALVPADNSISVPVRVTKALSDFLVAGTYQGWCHDVAPRTNDVRMTGPYVDSKAITTHARVRVYYSKDVVAWLDAGRKGEIPDGSMIVKEMFAMPSKVPAGEKEDPTGWALMLRDSTTSHDGWLWYLYYLPHNLTNDLEFKSAQYGLSFCVSCHASASSDQGTFAFLGNLENRDLATYVATDPVVVTGDDAAVEDARAGTHGAYASMDELLIPLLYRPTMASRPGVDLELLRMLQDRLGGPAALSAPLRSQLLPLPMDGFFDHVVATPGEEKRLFLTGDACSGCHDASYLLNTVDPWMTTRLPEALVKALPPTTPPMDTANLSPFGEWGASMMGLSARDPIFRAQFEYELASLEDPAARADVASLCMSCHSVMGERSYPELAKDPGNFYAFLDQSEPEHTPEQVEVATYAALARDGVSCTVCHHVAGTKLGEEETFTAKFETGPADEVYGPFDDVRTHPMTQAIGVVPKHGAQIQDAALCGSCHTIEVPVFKNGVFHENTYEQTTYMEWKNSAFATGGSQARTCQQCHMPDTDPITQKPMATKIANIEDTTFPYVPNRASSDELHIPVRDDYRRHTLVGINVFGMSMFQQFPLLLGSNNFRPNRSPTLLPPKILSLQEAVLQARHATTRVAIGNVSKGKETLSVDVRVENLAGHKLPSGVGFRRAFLELTVRDRNGDILWCSGCTDGVGVIVDGDGQRMPSEFATRLEELQPDHVTITGEAQVQIYEGRHVDCEGNLTTSFIRLCDEVKDNRILPAGWKSDGDFAEHTKPVPHVDDPLSGFDALQYRIPLAEIPGAVSVQARMNYQSIPPYYLVERFRLLAKPDSKPGMHPETERLLFLVLHLNVDDPRVAGSSWKLGIGCDAKRLAKPATPDAKPLACQG